MLKHWRTIVGILFFLQPAWVFIKWVLDWVGRIDVITSRLHEFGGQAVLDFIQNPPAWSFLPSIGMGLLLIWWDVRQKEAAELDLNRKLLIGFYLGCAVLCIGVWFTAWFISLPVKATPAPPTPTTALPAPPKSPPPPWVTPDEIEQQKKLGRNLLIYSPQNLFSMYEGSEDLSVFTNRWIKVNGKTSAVPVSETFKNKEYYKVGLQLEPVGWNRGMVAASFDPKKWGDDLIKIRPGEGIRAFCQFTGIDRKQLSPPYAIYLDTIIVRDCELL